MPTELSKISTYVEKETVNKFRVIAAEHGMSMSAYLKEIVIREIERANKAQEATAGSGRTAHDQ